jgi:hypothetical protein
MKHDAGVMGFRAHLRAYGIFLRGHATCFSMTQRHVMSVRAHLWLRIVGLAIILAAQFGPRMWGAAGGSSSLGAKIATAEAR